MLNLGIHMDGFFVAKRNPAGVIDGGTHAYFGCKPMFVRGAAAKRASPK